jgi:hypothetical protein
MRTAAADAPSRMHGRRSFREGRRECVAYARLTALSCAALSCAALGAGLPQREANQHIVQYPAHAMLGEECPTRVLCRLVAQVSDQCEPIESGIHTHYMLATQTLDSR